MGPDRNYVYAVAKQASAWLPPKNIWGLCWRISLAQPCLVQIGFCLRKLHSTVGSSRRSWKEVNIGKLQKPPGITWPAPHRPSSCGPETSPVLRGMLLHCVLCSSPGQTPPLGSALLRRSPAQRRGLSWGRWAPTRAIPSSQRHLKFNFFLDV